MSSGADVQDCDFMFVPYDVTSSHGQTRYGAASKGLGVHRHVMLDYIRKKRHFSLTRNQNLPEVRLSPPRARRETATPYLARSTPAKPERRVIKFSFKDRDKPRPQTRSDAISYEPLVCVTQSPISTVSINSFDPFDSLAVNNAQDTISILRSLYSPLSSTVSFQSWTHKFFGILCDRYWQIAMSDTAFYHIIGFQAYPTHTRSHFEHKIAAYKELAAQVTNSDAEAMLSSISLLLYISTHAKKFTEAHNHLLGLSKLWTKDMQSRVSGTMWFCIAMAPLNYCTATMTAPILPFYIPSTLSSFECQEDKVSGQVAQILDAFPTAALSISIATLRTFLSRYMNLVQLSRVSEDYEKILALYYDLKFILCGWSAGSANTRSTTRMNSRLTNVIVTGLHLNLWMLCSNRTQTQANAGAAEMILTVVEALPEVMAAFQERSECLAWVLTACTAYLSYTLRDTVVLDRLNAAIEHVCANIPVHNLGTRRKLMCKFAGPGVWPDEALVRECIVP